VRENNLDVPGTILAVGVILVSFWFVAALAWGIAKQARKKGWSLSAAWALSGMTCFLTAFGYYVLQDAVPRYARPVLNCILLFPVFVIFCLRSGPPGRVD
jgi:hypothetical protein